jgi:peptide deformylase
MPIRKIARMGHPILKEVAAPVADPTAPEIALLARDLMDTCEDVGGNGIAAPQIYEPLRMFAYRVRELVMPDGAKMNPIPWTVCINPAIEFLTEEERLYTESCLSLPGLYGKVPRRSKIRFTWTELDGETHAIVAHRYQARLLQHEYDHLDGMLYPMRMQDMGTLGYVSELGPPAYPALPRDPEDFIDPEPA